MNKKIRKDTMIKGEKTKPNMLLTKLESGEVKATALEIKLHKKKIRKSMCSKKGRKCLRHN